MAILTGILGAVGVLVAVVAIFVLVIGAIAMLSWKNLNFFQVFFKKLLTNIKKYAIISM